MIATNAGTGLRRQVLSAADGFYTIPLLPPGTYTVRAQRIGYQPSEVTAVAIRVGEATTLNFQIRAATVELEGSTVWVPAGWRGETDERGTLVLTR